MPDIAATKAGFSRFLNSEPGRLHFAAHSHHPWPDVSLKAHQQAWLDAAARIDQKWDGVFSDLIPACQQQIAQQLNLPPQTICFAPNTHEFVLRLLSCLDSTKPQILTTDSEFHSFSRQLARLEESGRVSVTRIPVQPYASFEQRFAQACAETDADMVFFSQVFYNSGYVVENLPALVAAVRKSEALVVIDGYHGFMARPTDLSAIADRVFYLAGGYKYAMAGEGACFMHCPDDYAQRPVNTGWYAGFGDLTKTQDAVAYAKGGARFLGSTFDPSGLYRFRSVQRWLSEMGWDVPAIHAHVCDLQDHFLASLEASVQQAIRPRQLIPPAGTPRGNFLCFQTPDAADIHAELMQQRVVTDSRADRLRFGFGIYQDRSDVDLAVARLTAAFANT